MARLIAGWFTTNSSGTAVVGADDMEQQNNDNENAKFTTLEHSDNEESLRQLWWTVAVTVVGLAGIAFFYL